jgi:tRNA/rRNA methyltransferase
MPIMDEPAKCALERVRIVLCRPSHPGNIGSAARAMKNMGLADLWLVEPRRFPAPEAEWLATGAADLLASAHVCARLTDALAECVAAYAVSARPREWSLEVLAARDAAAQVLNDAANGVVALVFGNESAGLTNEEMLACQRLVHIPANPAFNSLNLAQAVQVLSYELRVAAGLGSVAQAPGLPLATVADMEGLYAHLDQASLASGFQDPARPGRLRDRWRRLFSRTRLEREEVNILRGLLKALLRRNSSGQ